MSERKQLSLFAVEDTKLPSSTTSVEDTKRQAIQRFLDRGEAEPTACVGTYSPNNRKTEYFRLCYRLRRKVKCIHIPGGNVRAKLARHRAKRLQEMIDRGAKLEEVIALVQDYRSGETHV